ncbi:hypothetical protein HSB1_45570 [Halogranum salarium B-1]|uniref:Uncharacterized protein n=1 Tax=Halogranum salarium B-1 TaxID=1210908 RepID=J3JD46_9EURY|nr:hypothetical protein HSB1_45570 [Halogranum salarium B-1]
MSGSSRTGHERRAAAVTATSTELRRVDAVRRDGSENGSRRDVTPEYTDAKHRAT